DPNLLSCTPTLEMGIDIGDLSTLMLCSVPPDASSFRQRVGRAGRRDGNSLALTVARGRPHDLYFFADPMNMIAGDVSPPGVFLGASAVLERQFAAFCLDCWVRAGAGPKDLPERTSTVLNQLGGKQRSGFPYSFLKFVDLNRTELLERFFALFGDEVLPEVREHIVRFASSEEEGLSFRMVGGLVRMQKQRASLQRRAKAVRKALGRMKDDPAASKEEIDSLALEKRALERLFRELGERSLLNLLTDEGLIPNYAFPESGVTLRSVIYRRTADGKPESDVYKFERAAASALKELAPESVFYAGGRKARISQVDMSLSEVEEWRFCDKCSYMAPVGVGEGAKKCPRCGSSGFGDTGQKRKLLRMRQVFAYGGDRETMITDDSDDRETVFYTDQTLVDFGPSDIKSAWRSEGTEKPFGFEFISRAVLREVNFGKRDDYGEQVSVDGQLLPRKGFLICRHCGMVQMEGKEQKHTSICPARNKEAEANILDCVYLYRELHSEALRILLPLSSSAATEEDIHSFTAALQLGFKRYFRGDTGHLRCTRYQEPEGPSGMRRTFLLVYDTIPGGTGYLKQLALTGGELMEVLQKALDVLASCPCTLDPERDGCYRCIYAYGSSFYMKDVSRKRAKDMLSAALEHKDSMLPSDTIRGMEVNASFDSELEALFVEGLRRRVKALPGGEMANHVIKGRAGYFVRLGEAAWYLEPQVHFGKQDGVEVPSVADFVFWPARTREGVKPVVVFTDGYAFHRDRLGKDSAQRTALLRTGRFRVWSITWKDLKEFSPPGGAPFADPLYPEPATAEKMAGQVASLGDGFFAGAAERGEMDLLVRTLLHPGEGEKWRLYARYRAVMFFSGEAMMNASKSEGLRESLRITLVPWLPEWAREDLLEKGRIPALADRGAVRVCCSIDRAGMRANEPG
ncbi:MAG: Zn-binding domain-containing protein, partial [Aminivibrio sp.]